MARGDTRRPAGLVRPYILSVTPRLLEVASSKPLGWIGQRDRAGLLFRRPSACRSTSWLRGNQPWPICRQASDDCPPLEDLAPAPRRSWRTPARSARPTAPSGSLRVAGLTLLEVPARRRLAITVLVLTLRVRHVSFSISRTSISAGRLVEAGHSLIYAVCAIVSINKWVYVLISQARDLRPNSAANSPADAAKFRCRRTRSGRVQPNDITLFLGAGRAIFGRQNAFSP